MYVDLNYYVAILMHGGRDAYSLNFMVYQMKTNLYT